MLDLQTILGGVLSVLGASWQIISFQLRIYVGNLFLSKREHVMKIHDVIAYETLYDSSTIIHSFSLRKGDFGA